MKLLYAFGSMLRSQPMPSNDLKIFQQLYRLDMDPFLVDRTGTVTWPFNEQLDNQFSLPDLSQSTMSFGDAGIAQANELLDQHSKIYLFWSGGIDSTCMLVSFLMTGRPLQDQLIVVLNDDSVREYPKFYREHIRGKFQLVSTERAMAQATVSGLDGIFLNAEHADQLFGSPLANTIHRRFGSAVLTQPVNTIPDLLIKFGLDHQASQCIADLYQQTFDLSPRPINTVWDWFWWHNFNFKWQQIGYKLKTRLLPTTQLVTFYSGVEFQRWSVHHQPNLDSIETLKNTAKQVILDYTNDQEYFTTKVKHQSATLYFSKPSAAAVLEDHSVVAFDQFNLLDYYNSANSIAKWLNNQ